MYVSPCLPRADALAYICFVGTGRRFALTEACCFLAHLLRDWRVEIVARPGETKVQWRTRVMRAHTTMTMGVGDVPVRLVRRRAL